jgi:hypothetical protein
MTMADERVYRKLTRPQVPSNACVTYGRYLYVRDERRGGLVAVAAQNRP